MSTIQQLVKGGKIVKKVRKYKLLALEGCPQKRAICLKLRVIKPKKPNSAIRKIAKVRLSNKKKIFAYIPGQGHNLQEHAVVLVRGGRTKDLPGLRYKLMRGHLDFDWREKFLRKNKRSKYGYPKFK